MNVIVDASIWSLAYRRRKVLASLHATVLAELIQEDRVVMLGMVRQEVLSGIHEELQFHQVRKTLRALPDLEVNTDDHESAARFFNTCRAKGIQGSHTDFLICAVAARRDLSIFTTDRDFNRFVSVLPIRLHQPGA